MLVPLKIVETWYKRDSWVYKNFAHIYQNQLWSVRIPTGASVCRYFWQSLLLGLLVMRPLVVILHYLVLPICRKIGIGIAPLDRVLARWVFRLFHGRDPQPETLNHMFRGIGVFTVALVVFASWALFYFAGGPVWKLYADMQQYKADNALIRWVSLQIPVLSAVLLGITAYTLWNKLRSNLKTCKVRAYLILFAAYSISTFVYMLHDQLWTVLSGFGANVWSGLCFGAAAVWHWLCVVFLWVAHAAWTVIHWCGVTLYALGYAVWEGLTYTVGPWPIPLVVYMVVAVYLLYRLGLLVGKYGLDAADKAFNRMDQAQRTAYQREKWAMAMWHMCCAGDKALTTILHMLPTTASRAQRDAIDDYLAQRMGQQAVDVVCKDLLDKLQDKDPVFPPAYWRIKDPFRINEMTWDAMCSAGVDGPAELPVVSRRLLRDAIHNSVWSKNYADIVQRVKDLAEREAARKKLLEKRRNSFLHKTCAKFTDGVCKAGVSFAGLLLFFLAALGKGFVAAGLGIKKMVIWTWRNTGVFLMYLWVFLVARKKKACPYMQFKD